MRHLKKVGVTFFFVKIIICKGTPCSFARLLKMHNTNAGLLMFIFDTMSISVSINTIPMAFQYICPEYELQFLFLENENSYRVFDMGRLRPPYPPGQGSVPDPVVLSFSESKYAFWEVEELKQIILKDWFQIEVSISINVVLQSENSL